MATPKAIAKKDAVTVEVSPLQYNIRMERTVNGQTVFNHIQVTPPEAEILLKELDRAVKFSNRK